MNTMINCIFIIILGWYMQYKGTYYYIGVFLVLVGAIWGCVLILLPLIRKLIDWVKSGNKNLF